MRYLNLIIGIFLLLALSTVSFGQDTTKTQAQEQIKNQIKDQNQIQHGYRFVDKNGDGYNDNAPDADGDGIPNGMDPDYTGTGKKSGKGFVDRNGDGINDNLMNKNRSEKGKSDKGGYGPKDGTGYKGIRLQDGSGYGIGTKSGNCDETGPKGKIHRSGFRK